MQSIISHCHCEEHPQGATWQSITKTIIIAFLMLFIQGSTFVIDSSKNAIWHNDRGLFFLRMENYYGAVEEFKIAIALNHKSQASAVFYYNLGSVYSKLGVYELAYPCFQKAIKLNPDFFYYYENYTVVKKQKNVKKSKKR